MDRLYITTHLKPHRLQVCVVFSLATLFAASAPLLSQSTQPGQKEDGLLGLRLVPVPEVLHAHLPGILPKQALLVESVNPGSRAAEIGLKTHDIVIAVGAMPVKSSEELQQCLSAPSRGEREIVQIIRGGKQFALSVAGPGISGYVPPKSLFKPDGPPAVGVEIKPGAGNTMEVTLFYLNQANKMERHTLTGTLESIERQVGELVDRGQMTENIHDLVAPALKRLRSKKQ